MEDRIQGRAIPLRAAGLEVGIDIRAAGKLAQDILQAAGEHGADMIVIGSRGQNMICGLFLGAVACEVIRLSALPVPLEWIETTGKDSIAACERTSYAGLRRLLLATDFSPKTQAAETAAAKLALHAGVVDLVHVASPDETARSARRPVMARAALDTIAHETTAADRDADLIFVGKHRLNWVENLAIGSTAANPCEIVRRPVLMVPLNESET